MITWFLILCSWTLSFLFSGIEAGMLSIDPVRLRYHVKKRTRGARRLTRLLKRPERLLMTVLLVTNMADIVGILLLTHFLVVAFGYAGFGYAILIALPVHLFLLGVFPKSLFRRIPFRALAALAGVLEIASLVLWPVLELGERLGRMLLPQRATDHARLFAAREELKQIAVQSEREGSLTSTERAMIHNVVDFRGVKMRDLMVPITQVVSVHPNTPIPEVLNISAAKNVDRLPVISENNEAIGLVNVLDILCDKSAPQALSKYTRRIVTAGENEPAYRIMQRLRAARIGLAAVVDAQRKLIGIATGEEIIKRLVRSA